jgi:DNA mismatch repair protein MutL
MQPTLENTGFVFDGFTTDSVQISGLPVLMAESEVAIVLEELINNIQNEIPESSFSQSDTIAKSMAKSLAVKTGTYLTDKEQENLVNSLFACKEPTISPFQKPTFITFTVEDLDKRFAL